MAIKINEGLKNLIIKLGILFLILTILIISISLIFSKMPFYKNNLTTPQEFVEKTNSISFNMLINAAMIAICSFIILSYRKIQNIEIFKFNKNQFYFLIPTVVMFFVHFFIKYSFCFFTKNCQILISSATRRTSGRHHFPFGFK